MFLVGDLNLNLQRKIHYTTVILLFNSSFFMSMFIKLYFFKPSYRIYPTEFTKKQQLRVDENQSCKLHHVKLKQLRVKSSETCSTNCVCRAVHSMYVIQGNSAPNPRLPVMHHGFLPASLRGSIMFSAFISWL